MRFDHDLPASPRPSRWSNPGPARLVGLLPGLSLLAVLSPLASGKGVIYVDAAAPSGGSGTSWSDAFSDLQAALTAAAQGQGSVVWIAGGTYLTDQSLDKSKSFVVPSGVTVRGGFSGFESKLMDRSGEVQTVLSGDLLGNDTETEASKKDNAEHVIVLDGVAGVVLERLTVSHGYSKVGGGGIWMNTSTANLVECIVSNNQANANFAKGGGLLALSSAITMTSCSFEANSASDLGGGVCLEASTGTVAGSSFSNNTVGGTGGAVFIHESSVAVIEDCDFVDNGVDANGVDAISGGAVGFRRSPTSLASSVRRCRFTANNAWGGGGLSVESKNGDPISSSTPPVTVASCLFIGNEAITSGGGLGVAEGTAVVDNCTIYWNAAAYGGGISVGGFFASVVHAKNCILWGNTAPYATGSEVQVYNPFGAAGLSIDGTCIESATPEELASWGIENTSADPDFVDPIGPDGVAGTGDEDLRLEAGSMLIDAGIPDEEPGVDLAGTPRWLDGNLDGFMQVDPGAFEYSNVSLGVEDTGDALVLTVSGSQPLLAMLIVGRFPGEKIIWPYGALLIDPTQAWSRYVLGVAPVQLSVSKDLLAQLLGETSVTVQALGVTAGGKSGNFSAAREVSGGQ